MSSTLARASIASPLRRASKTVRSLDLNHSANPFGLLGGQLSVFSTDVLDKLCAYFRVPLSDLAEHSTLNEAGHILVAKWSQHRRQQSCVLINY
jgi:hypothetical protein